MKQGTRHVTRRAFLASMAVVGAMVPFARPSKPTAAATPLTKVIPKTGERLATSLGFNIRFHDLRHTHLSHLLANGVHPKIASERAGHASVAITLDVYSHTIPGMQENAANLIDAVLRT